MLAYFDQSARFCVHKQTNTQTNKHLDTPITLPLVRASRARGKNCLCASHLYVMDYHRYNGTERDRPGLYRALRLQGWVKVEKLTSMFMKEMDKDKDIQQKPTVNLLYKHRGPNGGRVAYAISKVIQPNDYDSREFAGLKLLGLDDEDHTSDD